MRIIVPIKQVPETNAVRMDEQTGTMLRDGVEAIVNPLDLYAIETAISLRDTHGGEAIALSMGPPGAATALREAIAMGIDAAVLVSDRALAGSDTWATSHVLAAAVRKLGDVDLVICGERATDGDTGQVGPGIASFLGLPVVTYVSEVEGVEDGNCRVKRLVEDGHEILDMTLPGVITVVKEIGSPRLPTLRGKQRAKRADIPTWGITELDIDADSVGLKGSPTRVVKIFRPSVTRQGTKLTPTDEQGIAESVKQLTALLRDRDLA